MPMNWEHKLGRRAALMPRNTVREFLKHAARPGVTSFAGGLPAAELFPQAAVESAASRVLARHGSKALQYGQTEGVPELREYLARKFHSPVENVLITSGAQQALDVIGRVLLDPGDPVLVENPTYLSLLSAWRPFDPKFRGVDLNDDATLARALEPEPKVLYCMPNFQNPAGTTLALDRRRRLAELVSERGLLIVEDDAYGELRYDGEPLPSLFELSGGKVIFAGTFSKVLAPGLRVGWIVAPRELTDAFVRAKQGMDLHTSTFTQYLAWELIEAGVVESQLPILRREYRARRDAMLEALAGAMPPVCAWNTPQGGMFLLLRLPPQISAREAARAALERNVLVVPGDDFHVAGGTNTLRLNFTNSQPEAIRHGIATLGELVTRMCQEAGASSDDGGSKNSLSGEK